MHVLLLGASRHIGFFVAQRLLAQGHTCTLLLRRLEAMQSEPSMATYIQGGHAKLVGGDALVRADVQRAWDTAKGDSKVDAVFFGIGGEPTFSLTKGAVLNPPDLTSRAMSVLLDVMQSSTTPADRPKLVTITSNGLDDRTHSMLPMPMRLFYGWALRLPHEDKVEQEKNVTRATGGDGRSTGWLPIQNVTIVRPAFLTDGECKAEKKVDGYRVGAELEKVWTVSRADVGHFVAEKVFADWGKWGGKAWVVGY
ncbi:NAD(P)H-binding family protein [Ceratobasidium sp. AG-Ba]|nr:NAD(P)H-binding family protein [Ceratobasidium sp. AG-Ba]